MPTNHARPSSLILGAACAVLLATGCKEDEGPGKLFNEDGAWELVHFSLGGEALTPVAPDERGEAFLLKFNAENQVVQTAMCAESEVDNPSDSLCRLLKSETEWFCQCFGYAFEGDQMVWREFQAGDTPPMVTFMDSGMAPPPSSGTGGGDTDTDGGGGTGGTAPGGDAQFTVAQFGEIGSTYQFTPFPPGVFGTNGATLVFEKKAGSKFDQVFEDPDGRATCEPCIPELAE